MRTVSTFLLALALVSSAPGHAVAQNQDGRPEALILATTFGFYQGVVISSLLDDADVIDGPAAWLLVTLASTVGTFGGAWYVTDRYGVNEAQGALFTSSFVWTMLNSSALGVGFDADADDMLWQSLVSGWTGQTVGILLAANVDQTAGQVSLMNSTATWSAAEVAVIQAIAGETPAASYLSWGTVAADAGLLAGVWLSSGRRVSRERARLVDLGALAGALAAPAALFMVWGPEDDLRTWYLSAVAVGIPAGIAAAWHLTEGMDEPGTAPVKEQTVMVPLLGGRF